MRRGAQVASVAVAKAVGASKARVDAGDETDLFFWWD